MNFRLTFGRGVEKVVDSHSGIVRDCACSSSPMNPYTTTQTAFETQAQPIPAELEHSCQHALSCGLVAWSFGMSASA